MIESGRPLRLLLVANRHQHNDGQGRVNYEVALAALNRGMKVTLLSAYCANEIAGHPNAHFVRIGKERLPTQLLKNLAFAKESACWIREHRGEFDLIQANGFITWERCDVVTAHFVHTSWSESRYFPYMRSLRPSALYQRLFTSLNARWERGAYRTARHIIAVSEIVAQDVHALGVPRERIEVIHNGVDTNEFSPGSSARSTFGLPENDPMLLFVGDIRSPRKNIHTLLYAVKRLPDVHLAVAGDAERSQAPKLAKKLKIADRVHFLGKASQIPMLMRSVDVFVFPSLYEPFGLVALEAAASGLPTMLGRDVGAVDALRGAVEVIDDPEDSVALAESIRTLLNSPTRRDDLGRSARKQAFSLRWSDAADAYLRTYEAMAGERTELISGH